MTREKFPEKIPFRLTRMLTNAMEVNESQQWLSLSRKGKGLGLPLEAISLLLLSS